MDFIVNTKNYHFTLKFFVGVAIVLLLGARSLAQTATAQSNPAAV
jgi:hypothetical protein